MKVVKSNRTDRTGKVVRELAHESLVEWPDGSRYWESNESLKWYPPLENVEPFEIEDWHAFAGAVSFADGHPPVTCEMELESPGGDALVQLVASRDGVELHAIRNDKMEWSSTTSREEWTTAEVDALAGLLKQMGTMEFVHKVGFGEWSDC